jgi:hypothetical protein
MFVIYKVCSCILTKNEQGYYFLFAHLNLCSVVCGEPDRLLGLLELATSKGLFLLKGILV